MRWLRRFRQRALSEKRLDSELQFHIEQQIADYVDSGLSPEEARRRARMEFGGVERFKEECRETHWENQWDILVRDFRFALTCLRKDRRFAFAAIFALALGIGASTSIFSVVDNALFEPFAYKDSRHLVTLHLRDLDQAEDWRGLFLYDEFQEFRKQRDLFDGMVANLQEDVVYAAGENSLLLAGNYVTAGTFEFYGVAPCLGRSLEAADFQAGAPPVFVMRYKTWVNKFGSDRSLIGKTFNLNGVSRTLVGIEAPRFAWGGAELWVPRTPGELKITRSFDGRQYWGVVARIRPGVSLKQAATNLNVIAQHFSKKYPRDYPAHFSMEVESFAYIVTPRDFRRALYLFSGAVGLLLLIGCANVANLLLARATAREKEFAVRAALGASRLRLVQQLLAESFLLAMAGAILGILFAWAGVRTIAAVLPDFTIASETVIQMNGAVLVFAVVVGVCTVFLFGLAPALRASRCNPEGALRDTGKGLSGTATGVGLRDTVVVVEVALSVALLFTASLFVRSFVALQRVPLGLRTDHVLSARVPLPPDRYKTGAQLQGFFGPLLARLKSMPGITYVAEASTRPPYGGIRSEVEVPGRLQTEKWHTLFQLCSEDYLALLRIPVLEGRAFDAAEVNDARKVVVVNQTFQRRYFNNEDPIGKKIQLNELKDFPDAVKDPSFEIIGVAADARNRGLTEPVDPEVWIPYTVTGSAMRGILVRTTDDPSSKIKTVAREIWAADRSVAMAEPNSLDYFLDLFTFAQPRFGLWIVGMFAGMGLLLVAIGVYSVMAYNTARRTHEFGLRVALGAAPQDVVKMVLGQGLRLLTVGMVIGLGTSLALSRMITSQLWGVSPHDPLTLAGVAALLLLIGLTACWVPARRATRVDPMTALRYE
jgi:putative ABC transport system permease protein